MDTVSLVARRAGEERDERSVTIASKTSPVRHGCCCEREKSATACIGERKEQHTVMSKV